MDNTADEIRRERRKLKTPMIKHTLLLLLATATLGLVGCADGIEPDREVRAAGYSPDPSSHIPRTNDSAARQAGF